MIGGVAIPIIDIMHLAIGANWKTVSWAFPHLKTCSYYRAWQLHSNLTLQVVKLKSGADLPNEYRKEAIMSRSSATVTWRLAKQRRTDFLNSTQTQSWDCSSVLRAERHRSCPTLYAQTRQACPFVSSQYYYGGWRAQDNSKSTAVTSSSLYHQGSIILLESVTAAVSHSNSLVDALSTLQATEVYRWLVTGLHPSSVPLSAIMIGVRVDFQRKSAQIWTTVQRNPLVSSAAGSS